MAVAMPIETAGAVERNRPGTLYTAFHDNFEVVAASTIDLLYQAHLLRYQVYCVEHPFEEPSQRVANLEIDEFDPRSVHALVRQLRSEQYAATVRLVLTGGQGEGSLPLERHCLEHIFPDALARLRQVERERVAEISRFAVSKTFKRRSNEPASPSGASDRADYDDARSGARRIGDRAAPHITLGLFAAIVRMSVENDITHWLAVMEPTLLRLLGRFGIHFPAIGPLVDYHGIRRPTLAVAADVVEGVRRQRPEVWEIVTDRGRYLPAR